MAYSDQRLVMGVDIGGTNTRTAVMNQQKQIVAHNKFPTKIWGDAPDAVAALADWLRKDMAAAPGRVELIAVGIPAPLDKKREKILSVTFVPKIAHLRLPELLASLLQVRVVMDKDTNYLLRRDIEWWGREVDAAVGVYLGTGIGNAFWTNNAVYLGAHGASCEIGHAVWPGVEELCPCGKKGCVETIVSGSALARWMAANHPDEAVGDAFVKYADSAYIREFVENFAMIVASETNILDPDVLFLAGGVIMMPGFPKERLETLILQNLRTPEPASSLEMVFSQNQDGASAEGACLAALEVL